MSDEAPSYAAAMILYVLWRDTSPDDPESGLSEAEIEKRCNNLTEEEIKKVDGMYLAMQEDWNTR